MKNITKSIFFSLAILLAGTASKAQKFHVGHFDKVIVNPNIEVVFIQASEESVSLSKAYIDKSKIVVDVNDGKLKLSIKGWDKNKNHNPYNGTKASLVVTYRAIEEVVLKGDQDILFENKLTAEDFEIDIYGDSEVTMNEVSIDFMESNIYGDNTLKIKSGRINNQDFTVFGDSDVNTKNVNNDVTKIMVFGDASFNIRVNDLLKINSLGDADVTYSGNPKVSKGLSLGDASIHKAK